VNGGTVQVVAKAGSALAAAQTADANAVTVKAGLASFFADADAAQTTITNLLASASPAAGTLTTAQLSTTVRALDTALRQVATIERGVIKRAVALVRLTIDALDTTDGTT
jgi:G:T/U-mismatch repair DNA glycosylase